MWLSGRREKILEKIHNTILIIALFLSFSIAVKTQIDSYDLGRPYNIFYQSFYLLLCGCLIFELARRYIKTKSIIIKKVFSCASKLRLGVYFIHNLLIVSFYPIIDKISSSRSVKVIILFLTSTVMSYLISIFISKIPKVSTVFLNLKR